MGSARTRVDDFGLWIYLEGHVTEDDARNASVDLGEIIGSFDGALSAIVDRRRLMTIEAGAVNIFESIIRKNAPGRLKRLAVVCGGQLIKPHINLEELPPSVRDVLRYVDAGPTADWKMEAMQWVHGSDAPEHSASGRKLQSV